MNKEMLNNVNSKTRFRTGVITALVLILVPVCIFYLQEFMLRNPLEKMKPGLQLLNMVFWLLLLLDVYTLSGRLKVGVWVTGAIALITGLMNFYVVEFRGIPVQPWDLGSIRVAASVAEDYDYTPSLKVVLLALGIIVICIAAGFLPVRLPRLIAGKGHNENDDRHGQWIRGVLIICSLLLSFGYVRYIQADDTVGTWGIYDKLFTPTTMTYKDGTPVAFILESKYLSVDKPEGYSDSVAVDLLDKYADDNCVSGSTETDSSEVTSDARVSETSPNIIVIMNEAFSNLSILEDYETNIPVMPFTESLLAGADNTVSGYLNVSVLGGNTADTEYEFLTGDSMVFLPNGSIPYQQYITDDTQSMASILNEQGYLTVAMHPYKPTGWNRDKVYDYFGFDRFYSEEDYTGAERIRKYVSDEADFQKLEEIYEAKSDGQPIFIFNVTMQNHSSYTEAFDNFDPEVTVNGTDSLATIQYLSLIHRTDEALENLIEYYSNEDEPTIIVMFGDHQPTDSVVNPLYKLNGDSVYSLDEDELALRYRTPFILWANYDIEEASGLQLCPGILGARLLNIAGVKTSPYINFINEMSKNIDSVNIIQTIDAEGNTYATDELLEQASEGGAGDDSVASILKEYQTLQYYHLFGK